MLNILFVKTNKNYEKFAPTPETITFAYTIIRLIKSSE